MNPLLEVRNLISQYNFIEAKRILVDAKFDTTLDKVQYYELLLKITFYRPDENKLLIDYLSFLLKKEFYEELLQIFELEKKRLGVGKLGIHEHLLYLDLLYQLGQLSILEKEAMQCSSRILSENLYAHYPKFLELTEKVLAKNSSLIVDKFIYYISIGDSISSKKALRPLMGKYSFLKHEDLKRVETKVLNLREDKFREVKMLLKLREARAGKAILSSEDTIECLIIGKDNLELLLELFFVLNIDEKFILAKHIKSLPDYNFKIIKNKFPNSLSFFLTDVFVSKKVFSEDKTDIRTEVLEILKSESTSVGPSESLNQLAYLLGQEEKDLLVFLEKEGQKLEHSDELVVPLIQLEFYSAALRVLDLSQKDKKNLYLKAYVNLEMGNYIETLLMIDEGIENKQVLKEDIEFLYLKAQAHEKAGNVEEAHHYYQRISESDPNFRKVRKKIENETN